MIIASTPPIDVISFLETINMCTVVALRMRICKLLVKLNSTIINKRRTIWSSASVYATTYICTFAYWWQFHFPVTLHSMYKFDFLFVHACPIFCLHKWQEPIFTWTICLSHFNLIQCVCVRVFLCSLLKTTN